MSIWRGSRVTDERKQPAAAERQSGTSAHAAADLEQGQWVGEYVVVRKLGEGGFGSVYEALHPVIGKRAAVKVLHAHYSTDEGVASRFAAEARAVNQIRHKNIIDIFAFGELSDRRHYYVMELLDGVPLDVYLDRAERIGLDECLGIMNEIAKALQAAHDTGIAHRDLKPENVFLELDDEQHVHPKILDFGMAKLLAPGTLPVHKTRSGTPIGSPRYMSPEQCRGVPVDHRADIYAFGCMLYRMLAGTAPFEAGTALELMMAHVSAPPVPLSKIGPNYGPELDECLLKMLEKEPDNRPQSMLAALESLKSAAASRLPAVNLSAPIDASPLLVDIVREQRSSASTRFDASTPRREQAQSGLLTKRARQFWTWPVASLAAAAALYLIAHRQGLLDRDSDAKTTIPTTAAAVPTSPASAVPAATTESAASSPAKVYLTVLAQPAHAEVYLNGERIGVAPGPLSAPHSEATCMLTLKAQGYQSQNVTLVPSSDQTIRVSLLPLRARQGGKLSQDLENPY